MLKNTSRNNLNFIETDKTRKAQNHDKRQLDLMNLSVESFQKKQIPLNQLVGNMEFLLSALESIDKNWAATILEEITTLESINATEIIRESGEDITNLPEKERNQIIQSSVSNLGLLIEKRIDRITNERKEELLFPLPETKEIATALGDHWLMCPLCQEAWKDHSTYAMIRCPKCNEKLHNPEYKKQNNSSPDK